jgi:hypothetical protein
LSPGQAGIETASYKVDENDDEYRGKAVIQHLLQGTTFNRDFSNDYLELVKHLMRALRVPVPRGIRAVTEEILTQVTDRVVRTYSREQRHRPPIYAQLIALVGGYVIHTTGGQWHMHWNWAYQLMEPWVQTSDGHFLPIFYVVYQSFCGDEDRDTGSIDIVNAIKVKMTFPYEAIPDE